jgi:glycosyltransferase involved in cell wall biosynthesis
LTSLLLAISNHAGMIGGGEHSFIDLLCHLPDTWQVVATAPGEGEVTRRLKRKGLKTHILPLPPIRSWKFLKILEGIEAHRRLYKHLRPNIIYANGSRAALYSAILGKILGIPVVWHCRIAETDPYLDPLLVRLSSKIVANSKATAARFSTHFQERIQVVYNGVNIQWLRQDNLQKPGLIKDEWKVILTVARVSKWKRHDLILSAFEKIAMSDPNVHLVCIGAKDELQAEWWNYLQNRTRQSSFSSRIHWVGWVDDIRAWLRVADLLVLSSNNEPFGRVIIEAMACEVPVIATRGGGVPEIVRDGLDGILITPGNDQEMADAATRILRDRALREALTHSGIERANLFNLDTHVMKMSQLFEETINQLSSA